MRHGLKIKKIGRNAAHRKATLQSMSIALITHKRIETTLGKAKALRIFVEPILNRAKDPSTGARRQAFRRLQDKEAVKALYGEVASAIADRPGGYTRIVKIGQRAGDAAEMAVIEIVDFNDVRPEGAAQTKRRTRRSRAKTGEAALTATTAAPAAETPAVVAPEAPVADEVAEAEPEADAPETDAPEADAPEADAPETDAPEMDAPEEDAPEADASSVTPATTAEPSDPTGAAEPPPEAGLEGQQGQR